MQPWEPANKLILELILVRLYLKLISRVVYIDRKCASVPLSPNENRNAGNPYVLPERWLYHM